jgi:hypothetical protein
MAVEKILDRASAEVDLSRLERKETDLLRTLEAMTNRHERFPNVVTEQRLTHLRAEHAGLRRRILELRAVLLPVHVSSGA